MALNEQDRAWIHQEINAAVRGRNPWEKIVHYVPTTGIIAIFIFIITQWTAYVEFRTKTNDRLDAIEKSLVEIKRDLSPLKLESQAVLSDTEFQKALPTLQSVLFTAKQARESVSPNVIGNLQRKLLDVKDQNALGFWSATAEFISYRSQMQAGWEVPDLPVCSMAKAEITRMQDTGKVLPGGKEKEMAVEHTPFTYSNCKIVLDSAQGSVTLSYALSFSDITFDHCVVVYDGGTVVLFPVKVAADTPAQLRGKLDFRNCLFLFSFPAAPVPAGRQFVAAVLASPSDVNLTRRIG
jgi:hypothetical protein